MIAIGIGATSSSSAEAIAAAIAHTEQIAGQRADAVVSIEGSRFQEPLRRAAILAQRPIRLLAPSDVRQRSADCKTVSFRSLEVHAVASIAEASALAAAGPGSKLLVSRIKLGNVTAAAAISTDHVKERP